MKTLIFKVCNNLTYTISLIHITLTHQYRKMFKMAFGGKDVTISHEMGLRLITLKRFLKLQQRFLVNPAPSSNSRGLGVHLAQWQLRGIASWLS